MRHEHVLQVPRPAEEPTEKFFREIEQSGTLPAGISAPEAASSVLCALTMRISGGAARELATWAPATLRRLIDRCVMIRGERPEIFDRATFVGHIADDLHIASDAAERLARTVFAAVRARLPPQEIKNIDSQLPRDLLNLWARET